MSLIKFTLGQPGLAAASGLTLFPTGQIFVFDLNGDGWDDVVETGAYYPAQGNTPVPRQGVVLFGSAKGFVAAETQQFALGGLQTVHSRELVQGDFNEDGVVDFYLADHGYDAPPFPGEQNHLFLSQQANGALRWVDGTAALPALSDFTHSATVGDVNGDGHLDIFAGNGSFSACYLLLGDGKGGFQQSKALLPAGFDTPLTASLLADLDQDGLPDLVLGNGGMNYGTRQVLWNDHGSFAAGLASSLPAPRNFGDHWSVYDIQATDVNYDGLPDLLVAYQGDVANGGWYLQVLVNQGGRTFSDQTGTYLPDHASQTGGLPTASDQQAWIQFLVPRDFNGDGRTDFWVDGKAWGGKVPQDNFPVLLMHQADGSFATLTVGELRAAGLPDYFLWGLDYAAAGGGQSAQLLQGPFAVNGGAGFNSASIQFGPADSSWRPGTAAADPLTGGPGADVLRGYGGNDTLNGGGGLDVAVYGGKLADYQLRLQAGQTGQFGITDLRAGGGDGIDSLAAVERLQFADVHLALDLAPDQAAAHALLTMAATLGKAFPQQKDWAGTFLRYFDSGASVLDGATLLVQAGIMAAFAGGGDNTSFASFVYGNVHGAAPDAATLAGLVAQLDSHALTQAQMLADMALSGANQNNVNLMGYAASGWQYL